MAGHRTDVQALVGVELETVLDKLPTLVGDEPLLGVGEVDRACLEHDSLVQNANLTHLVPERLFPKDHLIVDDSNRPYVDLWCNYCLLLIDKALWRQVPISPDTLGSKLYTFLLGCLA